MKRLISKVCKILNYTNDLSKDLFFQALPEENKRDYYLMKDAQKTFFDNLPTK